MTRHPGFGLVSLMGGLLFGLATGFHPITINPWRYTYNLDHIARAMPPWSEVHVALVIALTLWLGGLSTADSFFPNDGLAVLASRLVMVSLGVWLIALGDEIAIIPPLVHFLQHHDSASLTLLAGVLFGLALMLGYLGMVLVWTAVLAWSWCLAQSPHHRTTAAWGGIGAAIGICGMAYALVYPTYALYPLAVTSVIPYVWTLWFAWNFLWRRHTLVPSSSTRST